MDTERLKEFWTGLTQRKINWKSLEGEMSAEEKKQAKDWLFERGFVVAVPDERSLFARGYGPVYVVFRTTDKKVVNPSDERGLWCFTRERYAREYNVAHPDFSLGIAVSPLEVETRYVRRE